MKQFVAEGHIEVSVTDGEERKDRVVVPAHRLPEGKLTEFMRCLYFTYKRSPAREIVHHFVTRHRGEPGHLDYLEPKSSLSLEPSGRVVTVGALGLSVRAFIPLPRETVEGLLAYRAKGEQ